MGIRIVAVGQRIVDWADTAVRDYLGRFPREFPVSLVEIRTEPRNGRTPAQLMKAEAEHIVVLDEHGRDATTMALARSIASWRSDRREIVFVIGGPDGLAPEVKARANETMRLSAMTLPHALARVLLSEQLYRAWSILAGHPYHRA